MLRGGLRVPEEGRRLALSLLGAAEDLRPLNFLPSQQETRALHRLYVHVVVAAVLGVGGGLLVRTVEALVQRSDRKLSSCGLTDILRKQQRQKVRPTQSLLADLLLADLLLAELWSASVQPVLAALAVQGDDDGRTVEKSGVRADNQTCPTGEQLIIQQIRDWRSGSAGRLPSAGLLWNCSGTCQLGSCARPSCGVCGLAAALHWSRQDLRR